MPKKHDFAEEHTAIVKHLREWYGMRFTMHHKDKDIVLDGIRGRKVKLTKDEVIFIQETTIPLPSKGFNDATGHFHDGISAETIKTISLNDPELLDKIVNFFKVY